jgi:cytochrome oxidase Cu insertion factor (SCO1/SenC/PrrC family)
MRWVWLVFVCTAAHALPMAAGQLGPKDGPAVPPNDLHRVVVGVEAPDFTLEDQRGRRVTLSDSRGHEFVILVFYRGHW